jgi:hypothetical protein
MRTVLLVEQTSRTGIENGTRRRIRTGYFTGMLEMECPLCGGVVIHARWLTPLTAPPHGSHVEKVKRDVTRAAYWATVNAGKRLEKYLKTTEGKPHARFGAVPRYKKRIGTWPTTLCNHHNMPLTNEEREFLEAFVYEITNGPPFGGPATRDLHGRGVWYPDLSWILTAYQRELSAEGKIPSGRQNPTPPPSPWENLEEVKLRNRALKEELQSPNPGISGAQELDREPDEAYR